MDETERQKKHKKKQTSGGHFLMPIGMVASVPDMRLRQKRRHVEVATLDETGEGTPNGEGHSVRPHHIHQFLRQDEKKRAVSESTLLRNRFGSSSVGTSARCPIVVSPTHTQTPVLRWCLLPFLLAATHVSYRSTLSRQQGGARGGR